MIVKEFIQMRRDRLTFAHDGWHPHLAAHSFWLCHQLRPQAPARRPARGRRRPACERTLLSAIKNTAYFDFVRQVSTEAEGRDLLARGEVQFVVNIPQNFNRDVLRGSRPAILVEADATDPAATGNALGALPAFLDNALQNDLKGPLSYLAPTNGPAALRVHALYNPEGRHPAQHRPRPARRRPDHDDGHDHRPGHHPRTRIRHHGKSSLHAHPAL